MREEIADAVLDAIADRANREKEWIKAELARRPGLSLTDLGVSRARLQGLVMRLGLIAENYRTGAKLPSNVIGLSATVMACIELTYRCAKGEAP